jgi:hypothetical protein
MHVPEGTKVGALIKQDRSLARVIFMGEVFTLGPLRAIPLWEKRSGVQLLFLMPLRARGLVVKLSGRPQAGAFLVYSGASFAMDYSGAEKGFYQFTAAPTAEVIAGQGELCDFCRVPLGARGVICLSPAVEESVRGKVLCQACAEAWWGAVTDGEQCD